MKSSAIVKKALHKADGVLYPVAGRKDKVVITISSCNVMQLKFFYFIQAFFVHLIFLNNHAFSDIL